MIHVEWGNDHLFPLYIIWSTWNDGITTFSPLYIWSTWSDYLFLLYMIHVEWPPFPILYVPRGICTRSSCWLLTTLWFSCLLQEPTVMLSVLDPDPSLSSLLSSGRSSVCYSSDELRSKIIVRFHFTDGVCSTRPAPHCQIIRVREAIQWDKLKTN